MVDTILLELNKMEYKITVSIVNPSKITSIDVYNSIGPKKYNVYSITISIGVVIG